MDLGAAEFDILAATLFETNPIYELYPNKFVWEGNHPLIKKGFFRPYFCHLLPTNDVAHDIYTQPGTPADVHSYFEANDIKSADGFPPGLESYRQRIWDLLPAMKKPSTNRMTALTNFFGVNLAEELVGVGRPYSSNLTVESLPVVQEWQRAGTFASSTTGAGAEANWGHVTDPAKVEWVYACVDIFPNNLFNSKDTNDSYFNFALEYFQVAGGLNAVPAPSTDLPVEIPPEGRHDEGTKPNFSEVWRCDYHIKRSASVYAPTRNDVLVDIRNQTQYFYSRYQGQENNLVLARRTARTMRLTNYKYPKSFKMPDPIPNTPDTL
jgi:hypothetical protein